MEWISNLLNNWLVQAIIGNIVWFLFGQIVKYLHKISIKSNKTNTISNFIINEANLNSYKKRFTFLYYVCFFSVGTLLFYLIKKWPHINFVIFSILFIIASITYFFINCIFMDIFENYLSNIKNRNK